ncbi:hypothetical protein D7D52_22610 [Nocardia yunnanensis]|uniref:Uncharacterized protein n=2 Tax=Nocardia yunnanensis TaxID=2382165 RepID=A0A386ZF73_9NOCA|nr:hypothetical protein D7D52_22610 [Nocardia yunnanensis]
MVAAVLADPGVETLAALHDLLAEQNSLDVADGLVDGLRGLDFSVADLRALARWLAEHGTRRNAVALGMVMLGVVGDASDRELLLLLGTFDDLTLYAVIALAKTQPDREQAIYSLARRVEGWGRIYAVERLRGTQDPDIKSWLLRSGFRNGILDQYLAHIAATTGDLYTALLSPAVDAELLDGASGILAALADLHGPTADIRHYVDALPCMARFGELIGAAPPNLTYISTARDLFDVLKRPPSEADWPEEQVTRVLDQYSALLARPDWRQHVRTALDHPATHEFRRALACAEAVGIDALSHALARMRQPRYDSYIWWWAVSHAPESERPHLVRLAREVLPLEEMAVGPEPGRLIGASDEESVLDFVLSYLGDCDAAEADLLPLIKTALSTTGTRLRGFGLRTLASRYGPDLPAAARAWVRDAAAVEPDEDLRAEFFELLEGAGRPDEK